MRDNAKLDKTIARYQEPSLAISKELGKLLTSILHTAILDYTRDPRISDFNYRYKNQAIRDYERYRHEAFLWFTSEDEGWSVHFSFRQCCELLGLCPNHVRRKLNLIDESDKSAISRTRRRI